MSEEKDGNQEVEVAEDTVVVPQALVFEGGVAPAGNPELAGQLVSLEQVEEACAAADDAADERNEEAIDWSELIETPTSALTLDQFSGRVGEQFSLQIASKDLDLELVDAKAVASPGYPEEGDAPTPREQFVLAFTESDPTISLPIGIYRLEHEEVGAFEVYLEEVTGPREDGSDPETQRYEAVFA